MQTSSSHSKCAAKAPQVPPFIATPIPQKISVEQLFGSSEELYSEENSHHSDSGESSGSNYESTSSFEERKGNRKIVEVMAVQL